MTRTAAPSPPEEAVDRAMAAAVRLAVRGHGRAEPNPMVGCVILDPSGAEVGWGFHRRVGGDHAEVEALRRAGAKARGSTLVVTLEPCSHHGRTPPCTDAIERAGVARVIFACADPTPRAGGGAARLRACGIEAELRPHPGALRLNAPFLHRAATGLPWVSAKWAQTIDGAVAARSGASKWISSERLRRAVHRERGRVDAILTGIGTVLADDPLLTPRGVTRRRMPLRVVADRELETPPGSALVRSASAGAPVVIAASPGTFARHTDRVEALRREGATVIDDGGSLRSLLARLSAEHDVTRLMVESGGGLVGALHAEGLVNECWVVIAPLLCGDSDAVRPIRGFAPSEPAAMLRRSLVGAWRRGDEMLLLYR